VVFASVSRPVPGKYLQRGCDLLHPNKIDQYLKPKVRCIHLCTIAYFTELMSASRMQIICPCPLLNVIEMNASYLK